MFALGIFVGGLVTLGFSNAASSTDNFLKVLSAVLTGTFGGAVVAFMDKFNPPGAAAGGGNPPKVDGRSFFMYPLGLVVALLWLYFSDVWNWGKKQGAGLEWIGSGAIVAITIFAILLAVWPGLRDMLN
jgi:hypothetical protein